MIYILNIETSTKNCSVSLSKDGVCIAWREIAEEGYSHAEKLHVFIAEVMDEAGLDFKVLSAVAVGQGPGSYTGLRIGVSAAKGLCYALNIPLIAVDTLTVLGKSITVDSGVIIPMIDARRMECYTAVFDSHYYKIRPVIAEIITENSFVDIDASIHLIGDGAMKCKEVLTDSKFNFYPDLKFPSAIKMCELSFEQYTKSDTVNVAYFEPFYLKDFMMNTNS